MLKLKVTSIGNSLGLILPKELIEKLNVGKGDTLTVTPTANGVELTPYDAEFDRAMEAGRKVMRRYRNTLRELAK
jgi:putative addiction module antidote